MGEILGDVSGSRLRKEGREENWTGLDWTGFRVNEWLSCQWGKKNSFVLMRYVDGCPVRREGK